MPPRRPKYCCTKAACPPRCARQQFRRLVAPCRGTARHIDADFLHSAISPCASEQPELCRVIHSRQYLRQHSRQHSRQYSRQHSLPRAPSTPQSWCRTSRCDQTPRPPIACEAWAWWRHGSRQCQQQHARIDPAKSPPSQTHNSLTRYESWRARQYQFAQSPLPQSRQPWQWCWQMDTNSRTPNQSAQFHALSLRLRAPAHRAGPTGHHALAGAVSSRGHPSFLESRSIFQLAQPKSPRP